MSVGCTLVCLLGLHKCVCWLYISVSAGAAIVCLMVIHWYVFGNSLLCLFGLYLYLVSLHTGRYSSFFKKRKDKKLKSKITKALLTLTLQPLGNRLMRLRKVKIADRLQRSQKGFAEIRDQSPTCRRVISNSN